MLVAGLVLISTAFVDLVTPTVPHDAAGVIYLVGVLAVSSLFGLWWGLATSLASALAFNFFFLPPAHTLVINSSSDWAALGAFVADRGGHRRTLPRGRAASATRPPAARRRRGSASRSRPLIADAADVASVLPALATAGRAGAGRRDGAIRRGNPPRRAKRVRR